MLSDAELFDFNAALLEDYDDERAHANLKRYGDAFRFQLVLALFLDEWVDVLKDPESAGYERSMGEHELRGWVWALQGVADSLRSGDYLPGGCIFEHVVRGR